MTATTQPTLVELLEAFLDAHKMLGKQNQAGLVVLPAEGGAFVYGVDPNGAYRSFDEKELKFLRKWDLHLDGALAKNGETVRRADMLNERRSRPEMKGWESLDASPSKSTMPPASVRGDTASNIPRIYAAVDTGDPKQAQIVLFASEFGVDAPAGSGAKTRRLDEAVLRFDVDDVTAQEIVKGNKRIKDVLKTVRSNNPQVIYYDNNRELTGRARVDHNIKTIDTLEAWLEALPARFGIKLSGTVQVGCVDILESAIGVQVEEAPGKQGATAADRLDASEKKAGRRAADPKLSKPGSQAQETMIFGAMEVDASVAGKVSVKPLHSQRYARFKTAFSAAEAAEIEARFVKFLQAAEAVLKKMV
ncbi:MAG: hypothetical protein IT518_20330 [Burkholderiales bacterium]|nr:hypothetical protein [Burkholderiales bacterium]